jgi:hypothetical protein
MHCQPRQPSMSEIALLLSVSPGEPVLEFDSVYFGKLHWKTINEKCSDLFTKFERIQSRGKMQNPHAHIECLRFGNAVNAAAFPNNDRCESNHFTEQEGKPKRQNANVAIVSAIAPRWPFHGFQRPFRPVLISVRSIVSTITFSMIYSIWCPATTAWL